MAINPKLLNEGETVVLSTRTHPKALILPLFALVILLAVGTFVQVKIDQQIVDWVVWGVVAIGIVWYVVRPALIWASASYTFTSRRLVTRTGVLTRRGHDIPLTRISDVAIELHLTDRLLGCGTLIISDASTHGSVELPDIPHVEDAQRMLNDLLHDLHAADPRGEGV